MKKNSFGALCERYLEVLADGEVRPSTLRRYWIHYRNIERHIGGVAVKKISYGVLEDLKLELTLAPKTVYDTFDFIKAFLRWCVKREVIQELPNFPKLSKKMGMRDILDKEVQIRVIEEVGLLYEHEPRAVLGVELLATYPKIRPGELRQVRECDLDLVDGWLTIPNPKESNNPKKVKLIPAHQRRLSLIVTGDQDKYLMSFRNGHRFGRDYLYNAWRKACLSLSVTGVPLYPGTKHTSATHMAKNFPYRMVKEATGVSSAAFERYININQADVVGLYESAAP